MKMSGSESETLDGTAGEPKTKPGAEKSKLGETVRKQLIVVVEGTAALGPFWLTIFSDYLEKIVRFCCGNNAADEKHSKDLTELSLIMFSARGPYSACLVQRSGWTTNIELFFQWLSALPFVGGGFSDAAIAEGLGEALMMFYSPPGNKNQNAQVQKHCVLVAASNPYPLPTPVYRPEPQNLENNVAVKTQLDSSLYDAETLAKYFPQFAISLSVICPKQLPKLRGIYNAGKQDPQAADSAVDNVKNPHFLVLISENFMEALASLNQTGNENASSIHSPVKTDETHVPSISGPSSAESALYLPVMSQQGLSGMPAAAVDRGNPMTNMPSPEQPLPASPSARAQERYMQCWEGNLYGKKQGKHILITRLVGYRKTSSPESLVADWPPELVIDRLVSQKHMKNKNSNGKADYVIFQGLNQHDFLVQLKEKKLCAIVQLPTQTLMLAVANTVYRFIGLLLSVLEPQNQVQQQQEEALQAPEQETSQNDQHF